MKIFITGSESFTGKELISQCIKRNIEVIGCDLVQKKSAEYEFYQADIRSPVVENLIPEGVDAVVHLASLIREAARNKAYECFNTNVMGTLNFIKAAKKKKAKQFIFASSELVYNDEKGEINNEDTFIDIANQTSEYALSKLVSEVNLRQQYQHGFCPVTILRFGVIYGPRKNKKNDWSAVESIFSAIKNQPEVTVGSLRIGRRFVHVSDIARGIIKSIALPGFNIINLVGDRMITLGEIIERGQVIFGKIVKINEKNPSQVSVRNPSNNKAKELLQWKPEIDLESGIKTILPFI